MTVHATVTPGAGAIFETQTSECCPLTCLPTWGCREQRRTGWIIYLYNMSGKGAERKLSVFVSQNL